MEYKKFCRDMPSRISQDFPMTEESTNNTNKRKICFVFDCVSEQYRKVIEWIEANPTTIDECSFYRVALPCTDEFNAPIDLGDYLSSPESRALPFKGKFECWPAHTVFEIKPLKGRINAEELEDVRKRPLECTYPVANRGTLNGFARDGYLSDLPYTLPDVVSGLSYVQQVALNVMDRCGVRQSKQHACTASFAAVCHQTSWETRVSVTQCEEQIIKICGGNAPWCVRHGGTLTRLDQPGHLVPLYLLNMIQTPKIQLVDMINILREVCRKADANSVDEILKEAGIILPSSSHLGYHFVDRTSTEKRDFTKFSGMDDDDDGGGAGGADGQEEEEDEAPRRRINKQGGGGGKKNHPDKSCIWPIKTYATLTEYLKEWIRFYVKGITAERPYLVRYDDAKGILLRRLYSEKRRGRGDSKRVFWDDNLPQKKAYLRKNFGEDFVDDLMNIPICEVTPENFMAQTNLHCINPVGNHYQYWFSWDAYDLSLKELLSTL